MQNGRDNYMTENMEIENDVSLHEGTQPDSKPIEPERKKIGKPSVLKWVFFLFVIFYVLLSYYYAPILIFVGRYLVVTHEPEKSDLIVCLAGGNIERGLSVADAYEKELAPRIFISREELPDGYELLEERGIDYPESIDLLVMVLEKLGVPSSALVMSDRPMKSTFDEAKAVKEFVKEKGYQSLIIITSPTHSRRAWLTFKKFFENEEVRILILTSSYSGFRPEDWWKDRKYVRAVIIEYQKLIFYTLKYLW